MKKILLPAVLFCLFAANSNTVNAAPVENPDVEESTKLNLWIPGFVVKLAADMVDDHLEGEEAAAVDFMRKLGSMNICIREGAAYRDGYDAKMTRKLNRMDRRNYEPLMQVLSDEEKVNMSIRTNKRDKIKGLVVMVNEPGETFVFVKMRCNLKPEDITTLVSTMQKFETGSNEE